MSFAPERNECLAWGFNTSLTCHWCPPMCVCFWCHHCCAQKCGVVKNLLFRFNLNFSRSSSLCPPSPNSSSGHLHLPFLFCTITLGSPGPSAAAPWPRDPQMKGAISWDSWAVPHCSGSSVILQERDLCHIFRGIWAGPQAATFHGREALFLTHEIYIYIYEYNP